MFYPSIAPVYNYIFPKNPAQLTFIERIQPIHTDERILEIGAATGNLTSLLYSKTTNIIGLDLDDVLLDLAKKDYPKIQFMHENMLNINSVFNDQFDRIISFGNTLVHLPTREHVKDFFEQAYAKLKTNGLFIVQIINFDRIVNQNITGLPTIDNDHIEFVRDYKLNDGYVDFITKLTIKTSNETIENNIPLLTLKKSELKEYLQSLGFKDIQFYGNLKGKDLESNDIPLLFSCKR